MMADEFTELAEPFVLGMLDEKEARQFQQHLATSCRECRQAVDEAKRVAHALPFTVPQNEPPAELKQRLLATIGAEANVVKMRPVAEKRAEGRSGPATIRSMPQRTFVQRLRGTLAWAAVFLLFAAGYGYFLQRDFIKQLQQQLSARNAEIKLLQFEMERQKTVIEQIRKSTASRLLLVELKGTEVKPSGGIKILLDPQTAGGSFIAYDLPALPDEHDYQLWFLKDGKPFDAGVFHVNEKGEFIGEVQHLPEKLAGISAFAITREPKGGSPTPTMPIYWVGAVQEG
ncbi:anti-sigma factor [candidate division KSB1 bacterium]|nr:anti-sigma factor [candidate division KSB1 bacterium]